MPQSATANFITEAAQFQTAPQYLVRFSWVNTAGISYPFTRDVATHAIVSATKNPHLLLDTISGNTQTVQPAAGRSSVGQVKLLLIDGDGVMLKQFSNPKVTLKTAHTAGSTADIEANSSVAGYPASGTVTLENVRYRYTGLNTSTNKFTGITANVDGTSLPSGSHPIGAIISNGEEIRPKTTRVQLFAGYAPLAETDYMSLGIFEITHRAMTGGGTSWSVTASDLQRFLKKKLFLKATKESPVTLTGNPVDLALKILLTSGSAGTNHATYDTGTADHGVDFPAAMIDITGLEQLRDTHFQNETFTFRLPAPEDAKAFLEKEFWLAMNCVPFITNEGKYSAKRLNAADATALGIGELGFHELAEVSVSTRGFVSINDAGLGGGELGAQELSTEEPSTLTEDDIVNFEWRFGDEEIVNRVGLSYDYNLDTEENPGDYNIRQTYKAIDSKQAYGERDPVVIESKGIKTANGGQTIADDRALFFLKRFAEPPPILTVTVFYRNLRLEVMDVVLLTHADIPDPTTGTRGVTAKRFEVLDITPRFGLHGGLDMTLLSIDDFFAYPEEDSDGADRTRGLVVDSTPPSIPTGLALTTGTQKHAATVAITAWLEATWTANAASESVVYYNVEAARADTKADVRQPTQNKILFENMPIATVYTVKVSAVDGAGNDSGYSATVNITTGTDTTPPAVPTGLAFSSLTFRGNTDGTRSMDMKWTWTANTEADLNHYHIHLTYPGSNVDARVILAGDNACEFTNLNQATGNYVAKIKAFDKNGNASAYSGTVTKTLSAGDLLSTAPAAPGGLAVTSKYQNLFLTWNNNSESDLAHYQVYRHTSDITGSDKSAASLIATVKTTFYTDLSVGNGITRFYWIKAVNASGNASAFFPSAGGVTATSVAGIAGGDVAVSVSPLVIDTVDGIKVESEKGIFFNTTSTLGHRIKTGTAGDRLLTVEPQGAISNPQVDIGTYDQVRVILEESSGGFIVKLVTSGDILSVLGTSGTKKIGFFGTTAAAKPTVDAGVDGSTRISTAGSLKDLILGLETLGLIGKTATPSAFLSMGAANSVTLDSSGEVTVASSRVAVDTYGSAASDDCVRIHPNGITSQGDIIVVSTAHSARDITFKDASISGGSVTGNLLLAGDFTADSNQDVLVLMCDGYGHWLEISRNNNQ